MGKLWRANKRQLKIVLGLAILIAISIWLIQSLFFLPRVRVPLEDHRVPPVFQEILEPTELQKTITAFSPWGVEPDFGRALLLLQEDGGQRVSSWSVEFPNKHWSGIRPPELSRMTITIDKTIDKYGRAQIQTNKGRNFSISVNQPFVFEQTPQMVYLITEQGEIFGINVKDAESLRYKMTRQ